MSKIRFATLEDSDEILFIYTPYVLNTNISFEYLPPSSEDFAARMSELQKTYPCLVYVENNEILGYAYASPYCERIAYIYSTDLSIYLHPYAKGKGIRSEERRVGKEC